MGRVTSLIVQTKTSAAQWSDSVDLIYFDIGARQWLLRNPSSNPNHRDFAVGQISTFHLQDLGNLDEAQIRKIRLEKPGGDGWKPEWIKVWVNNPSMTGAPFYFGTINMFLKSGNGTALTYGPHWEASDFPERFETDAPAVTSLIVKVTTDSNFFIGPGTDDHVYFDIGTRAWNLDNNNRNDFERGRTDTFVLRDLGNLKMSDIRQIGLFKTGTDNWRPNRIQVWVNDPRTQGAPLFDTPIDISLDDDANDSGLSWVAPNYPQPLPTTPAIDTRQAVTSLIVETRTSTTAFAGSNDNVFFNVGSREWKLDNAVRDDFEEGRTDTFTLSNFDDLKVYDIRKIALRKTGTDGWVPQSIKVYVNDPGKRKTPFYEGTINMWLDGGTDNFPANRTGLKWEATDFYLEIPVACHFVIGQNDSTITPRRSKEASTELFDNYNTAEYRKRVGSANGIWTQGRLKFRVVSWNDVQVPDTQANIMPDRTVGDFTNLRTIARNNNVADRLNIYFVRSTLRRSNWYVGGSNPACWVQDIRNGGTVNTRNNFDMVVSTLSHEIGHFFGLPHDGAQTRLMTGNGTNGTSEIVTQAEVNTVFNNAKQLAENIF